MRTATGASDTPKRRKPSKARPHSKTIESLLAVRTDNVWTLELEEGDTAFTGDPERPSEKCTGCMSCMAACALSNEGIVSSELSAIRIHHHTAEWVRREAATMYTSSVCRQCPGVPTCALVCPVDAHYRDERTGAVLIDHTTCIRCRKCEEACPYQACWFAEKLKKIVKCTLCHKRSAGAQCVIVCPSKILKVKRIR